MPLPGGATDKFGNRYEGLWTVACMIRVMDEKADSIRLEPPGAEGEGVEFWLTKAGEREYHQVKRQQSASGRWTLADLQGKKILSNFWEKLKSPTATCVFVSGHAAYQLDELADRARRSAAWQEFDENFLQAGKAKEGNWLKDFKDLCGYWTEATQEEAYEALKRTRVTTISERDLRENIESRLAPLVDGEVATAVDVLAQYALDKIHHELTAHDIWQHLGTQGFRRRQWNNDPHVWAAVDKVNHLYFSRFENEKIAGEIISRDEVNVVIDKLLSPSSKRGVLLTGEAGVGKSGVIGQVVTVLRARWIPLIAFRIDLLEPTQSPDALGQQLEGLPGSPANILAAISQGRECVLIIDQIDAVSEASGRNPWFFECVDKLIKQAQANPNIHLLLACRKFDLENDSRLRRLAGEGSVLETVIVNRLSHETVKVVCQKLGLDATRLNQKQLDLLSIPLHLNLLAAVSEDRSIDVFSFRTVKDLYDQFWDYKKSVLRIRLYPLDQWTNVIDVLCDYMSSQQKQSLSAPKVLVIDDYDTYVKAMASEHVLALDSNHVSFFHQEFFDYAFARRFALRGQELLPFLQGSEQHLFRRAQVRQILLHERDADFDRYLNDLKELLNSPTIRFHLKQVVLALLAALDDPKLEEWETIVPLMSNQSGPIAQQVWQTLYSSTNWFHLLDSLKIVEQWLSSGNEEWIDKATTLLSRMKRQLPDRVAELLEPYIDASAAWRNRLMFLMQWGDVSAGRRFFELFLRLIDNGILDEARGPIAVNSEFWNLIYSLPKQHPNWACEVIGHYLNRRLSLSLAAGQPNPFDREQGTIPDSQFAESVFVESARNAPEAYVNNVLSFMLCVMNLTAYKQDSLPWRDPVWGFRTYGVGYGADDVVLKAAVIALSNLAINHPETFWTIAENQLLDSNFETTQYLLVRAFTANAEKFANEAVDYLCEKPVRLETGYSGVAGNAHAAPFWATRELLEAATPHCSVDQLAKLETVVLAFYTNYEKSAEGKWFYGYPQLVLLEGITLARRSNLANRRLEEWKRKFAGTPLLEKPGRIEPPQSVEARSIGSPISEKAASKMTDEQWLKAIARYDYADAGSRFQRTGELIGGASQLSSVLEKQVKKEPLRFAALVWRFPNDASPYYFDAVLRGTAEAEIDVDVQTALNVCLRCHQVPQHPCGRSISWLFKKLSHLPWTATALDILTCYALNDSNPEQEFWRTSVSGGGVYYNGDVYTAGINSTRGSAISAIASLIFADKDRTAYFLLPLQQAVGDSSIAVRSCVAEVLTAVLNYNRDLAVNLFLKLCETEDVLLGTQFVEHFLYYALPTHLQELTPILERILSSNLPKVIRVGARQACLSSIDLEEATSFAERCLIGSETHRLAAAEIFVANLRSDQYRKSCEKRLIRLFNDPDEKVRNEAAKCFFKFKEDELGNYTDFVQAFVDSPAFTANCHDLIYALEKTTAKLPDVTCLVCEKFVDSFGAATADIRTSYAADADTISELLIRVYSQSKDRALQSRCLDVVDRMAQLGTYGLDKALQQFER